MNAKYELLATPCVTTEGEYKGQLKGILFVAQSPTDKMQWFAINCGQFEAAFGQIVCPSVAENIVATLLCGEDVAFPGRYCKKQFDGGFHFAWHKSLPWFKPPTPDANGNFLWGV
jgi:hypothetical protein